MASVFSASCNSTFAHSSRSLSSTCRNQPPCLKPSSPVGSWTTPSSETFSLITIFPISGLLPSVLLPSELQTPQTLRNWAPPDRPVLLSSGVYREDGTTAGFGKEPP